MQTTITLPLGVTWASPTSELYRALRGDHPELAELIGREQDADDQNALDEAALTEAERAADKLRKVMTDIAADLNDIADKLTEIDDGMLGNPLAIAIELIEGVIQKAEVES